MGGKYEHMRHSELYYEFFTLIQKSRAWKKVLAGNMRLFPVMSLPILGQTSLYTKSSAKPMSMNLALAAI